MASWDQPNQVPPKQKQPILASPGFWLWLVTLLRNKSLLLCFPSRTRLPKTPALAQAAWWWPLESSGRLPKMPKNPRTEQFWHSLPQQTPLETGSWFLETPHSQEITDHFEWSKHSRDFIFQSYPFYFNTREIQNCFITLEQRSKPATTLIDPSTIQLFADHIRIPHFEIQRKILDKTDHPQKTMHLQKMTTVRKVDHKDVKTTFFSTWHRESDCKSSRTLQPKKHAKWHLPIDRKFWNPKLCFTVL